MDGVVGGCWRRCLDAFSVDERLLNRNVSSEYILVLVTTYVKDADGDDDDDDDGDDGCALSPPAPSGGRAKSESAVASFSKAYTRSKKLMHPMQLLLRALHTMTFKFD